MGRGMHIGLTGGIGSGKSTVAAMLVSCGARLVDTDAIARELTGPGGAAMPALVEALGADIRAADGSLDRDRMRARVFADPAERRRLEAVLHPLIGTTARARAEAAADAVVVFDVPLLTESSHWRQRVQRVLVVDCRTETQVTRVMQRNGWPRETVEQIIAQQATRAQRRRIADAVIVNDGLDRDALTDEVRALWRHWVTA